MEREIKEIIEDSTNQELFLELYTLITQNLKDEGSIFKTNSGKTMIGFKYIDYQDGVWPVVSIASQKNNISVYLFAFEDNDYIVDKYGQPFGKSNIGKSCIRIKKLNKERKECLEVMLSKI